MREQEYNLWQRYLQARKELILFYLPQAKFWAKKISRSASWVSQEDLMQSGVEGIIKAIDRFDLDRGLEFSTFARHYIREAMFSSPGLTICVKRGQYKIYRKVKAAHDRLMERLERKPTIEEIAREAKLTVEQVEKSLCAMNIAFADEFPDTDSEQPVEDTIERQEGKILVQEALAYLSKEDALILTYHFREDLSDEEIAQRMDWKRETVKKRRHRAIAKLRKLFKVEED